MRQNWRKDCTLCPRECHADRTGGQTGFCGAGSELKAARAALHFWEEPCISGKKGSGAVFFSGCSLGCVYCQNYGISRGTAGKEISVSRLAEIFFELEQEGAQNINLVTPTHFAPRIAESIARAKRQGFRLPFVWNSGGYEKVETLRMLDGLIDIYLPDFKYMSASLAGRYSGAPDYPRWAKAAVAEMFRQVGEAEFGGDGGMRRGMIVRHLTLPGCLEDSKAVLKYLFESFGNQIYYSIMNQFTPLEPLKDYPELYRKVPRQDYDALVDFAVELGIENGFVQEGGTAAESFIPAFDGKGV